MSVASSMGSPTLQLARPLDQQLREAVGDRAVHEDALGGGAALAGEVVAADDGRVGGALQVGVGQHDLRAVAAELEHAVAQAGVARDLLARLDRAREDDRRDAAGAARAPGRCRRARARG